MNFAATLRRSIAAVALAMPAALGASILATPVIAQVPPPVIIPAAAQQGYEALFKQMYDNPGNLEVSFKFAEQAAAHGDYEAAIGALERMLFFNPNLPRVKLELGVLYFKLRSYDLARGYFQDAIKGGDVPDDIRAQVNAYLAEIARREAPYELTAFVQAGARWQSNANTGPDSTIVRAIGQDAILNNQFARAPDWNAFQLAAMQFNHKINKRGDAFELTLTGYASQQQRFRQFDLGLVEMMVGPRIAIDDTSSFKVYGIGNVVTLANARYFNTGGMGVSYRSTLGSFGLQETYVEHRRRTFYSSVDFPTAAEQTSQLTSVASNADLRLGFVRLTTRLGYDHNRAETVFNYNSYDRFSIDIGMPFEFSVPVGASRRNVVITPTAGYSDTQFRMPNFIVDPTVTRHDRESRLGLILDTQIYENIGLRTHVTHTWIDSNLPNYTMKNLTVSVGPTARF